MRKNKRLTKEQIEALKKSPVVKSVTLVGATYKFSFKFEEILKYKYES